MSNVDCPTCGEKVKEQARFCQRCGTTIPQMDSSHAQLLSGRYQIMRKLGQGCMGAVYLANDTLLPDKLWVIKEMTCAAITDPTKRQGAIQAFQQEARMLATLNHADILKMMDYFDENGNQYLVMEFVNGKDVGQINERILAFCDQKPGNLIVQVHPDGTPVLDRVIINCIRLESQQGDSAMFDDPQNLGLISSQTTSVSRGQSAFPHWRTDKPYKNPLALLSMDELRAIRAKLVTSGCPLFLTRHRDVVMHNASAAEARPRYEQTKSIFAEHEGCNLLHQQINSQSALPRLDRPLLVLGCGGSGRHITAELKASLLERYGSLPQNIRILTSDNEGLPASSWKIQHRATVKLERHNKLLPLPQIKHVSFSHSKLGNLLRKANRMNIDSGLAWKRQYGLLNWIWDDPLIRQSVRQRVESIEDVRHEIDNQSGINVALAGSLCGGQDSGSLLDAAYFVHEALGEFMDRSRSVDMFVLPSIFAGVDDPSLLTNSYGFGRDLNILIQGKGQRSGYLGSGDQAVIRFPAEQRAWRCGVRQASAMISDHFLAPVSQDIAPEDLAGLDMFVVQERLKLNSDGAPYHVQLLAPLGLERVPAEGVPALVRTVYTNYQQRRVYDDFFSQMAASAAELKQETESLLAGSLEKLLAEGRLTQTAAWLTVAQKRSQEQHGIVLGQLEHLSEQFGRAQGILDKCDVGLDQAAESLSLLRGSRMRKALTTYLEAANELLGLRVQQRQAELTGEILHQTEKWCGAQLRRVEAVIVRLRQVQERLNRQEGVLLHFVTSHSEMGLTDGFLIKGIKHRYTGTIYNHEQQAISWGRRALTWVWHEPRQLKTALFASRQIRGKSPFSIPLEFRMSECHETPPTQHSQNTKLPNSHVANGPAGLTDTKDQISIVSNCILNRYTSRRLGFKNSDLEASIADENVDIIFLGDQSRSMIQRLDMMRGRNKCPVNNLSQLKVCSSLIVQRDIMPGTLMVSSDVAHQGGFGIT